MSDRLLDWDGCLWARDLGGLPTTDGRETRRGALVRAGSLDRLTPHGWSTLQAHGVKTVIDMRNDDERTAADAPRPPGLASLHVPLDASEDREFWDRWSSGPQFGTPLYYAPFLERFPDRAAAVLSAIARAAGGAVLYHCGRGRDRTGLITILVLALADVEPEHIAADYELSVSDEEPELAQFLERRGTSARELVLELVGHLDVERYVRDAGLTGDDVAALRRRLVT